jgi:thioredoxin-dependent peroxiredoxin
MAEPKVKDFSLPSTDGGTFELSKIKGKAVVIYFYPKDNTPGCTTEGLNFRDAYKEFQRAGVDIVGISRDSMKSHLNFKQKMGFPFELLSDEEETACSQFGVIKMKNMYGKQVRGIERSTFIIAKDRTILKEWRGLKVPGHVDEVLGFVKSL